MTPASALVCPFCRIALTAPSTVCPRDGHAAVPVTVPEVPSALAKRFRVLELFAQGGTGTLFLADESESGRRGLLKLLASVPKHREPERARLRRELAKQTTLATERLVVPLASSEAEGSTWLFRPWLEGVSLRVRMSRGERLPREEALTISAQLAVGLDELHRAGLLHRDVKPGHVFLNTNSQGTTRAVLIDPGLTSSVTRPGNSTIFGTLGYVAPEQLLGKLVSFRSDLYSLGCVMYEMFAGRPPFTGETEEAVRAAQLAGNLPPLPEGLPDGLITVLRSLLAKEPQDRPFSAQKLRRLLDPYAPDGTPMTRPPTSSFGTLNDSEQNTLHDLEQNTRKPAGPSVPPPPPDGALRSSPSKLPPALPRPSTVRPTARGMAPPPPPPRSAPSQPETTQQLDLAQLEQMAAHAQHRAPADQTMDLSPEHFVALETAGEPEHPTTHEREDYTVPVRLDQILAISSSRLRASVAPPAHPASTRAQLEAADPSPTTADAVTTTSAPQQTMFVDDEPQTEPFSRDDNDDASEAGDDNTPAPSSSYGNGALFGDLPAPNPSARFYEHDKESDDSGAVQTIVAHHPSLPPPKVPPNVFARSAAQGDDDPTRLLPADGRLSQNTRDESDDDEIALMRGRGLTDSLRPLLQSPFLERRKLAIAAGAVAAASILFFGMKALLHDEPTNQLAQREPPVSQQAGPGSQAPAPPVLEPTPTVEPAPSVTALAAPPKGPSPAAPTQAEIPQPSEPAPSVEPKPERAPPAASSTKAASAARPHKQLTREEKRRQKREERERAATQKAAAKQAQKSAKQAPKGGATGSDRTDKALAAREEAREQYSAGNFKQAAQAYERAIQYEPTNVKLFAGLGMARTKLHDLKGAASAYERAVQLSPSSSVYHLSLGRLYAAIGDKNKAKAAYKRALTLDPKNAAVASELKALGG